MASGPPAMIDTDAASMMARSIRVPEKVLMPCSSTLFSGNRSTASTVRACASPNSSTASQPETIAPWGTSLRDTRHSGKLTAVSIPTGAATHTAAVRTAKAAKKDPEKI